MKLTYYRPTKNCQLNVSSMTNAKDFQKNTSKYSNLRHLLWHHNQEEVRCEALSSLMKFRKIVFSRKDLSHSMLIMFFCILRCVQCNRNTRVDIIRINILSLWNFEFSLNFVFLKIEIFISRTSSHKRLVKHRMRKNKV